MNFKNIELLSLIASFILFAGCSEEPSSEIAINNAPDCSLMNGQVLTVD